MCVTTGGAEDVIDPKFDWIIDSGCTTHICNNKDLFTKLQSCRATITTAGAPLVVTQKGEVQVNFSIQEEGEISIIQPWTLKNVLYIPDCPLNLISLSVLDTNFFASTEHGFQLRERASNALALTAQKKGGLYVVDQDTPSEILLYTSKQSLSTWHNRLGHIGIKRLLQLRSQKATTGVDFPDSDVSEFECEICILGKAHRSPIKNKVRERATYPGERLHMDTCGPMQVTTTGGANYIVTIVDDYSRKHFALLVPDKRSIKEKVIAFLNSLKAQLPPQQKIRFIHCDIGGEFINQQLESYAHSIGALITTSAADTPEHNGTAERANQTIVSSARCMLIASGLPPRFWGEAVRIAVFIANASPTKANEGDATPDYAWDGKTTNLSTLRTFGCRVLVKDYHASGKFQVKAREGIYMGPGTRGDGHRIWIPATKAFVCSRDVYFLEEKGKPQLQDSPMIEISEDDDSLSELKGCQRV